MKQFNEKEKNYDDPNITDRCHQFVDKNNTDHRCGLYHRSNHSQDAQEMTAIKKITNALMKEVRNT